MATTVNSPGSDTSLIAAADSIAVSAEPSAWIKLLPAGSFTCRDGRGPFRAGNAVTLEAILARTREHLATTDMMADYDHQSILSAVEGVGGTAKAAGWIKAFEIREDGIYGQVDWTDAASTAIKAREYRYISPLFTVEKSSGRVMALRNAALVNMPALDLEAIAARFMPTPIPNSKDISMDQIALALGLSKDASEADTAVDVSLLEATVTGWLRSDLASPRDQIEVLAQLYRFDAVESEGLIKFIPLGLAPEGEIETKDLAAPDRNAPDWSITRAQETDLPLRAMLVYWDAEGDYRQTSSAAGRLVNSSDRVTRLSAPAVIDPGVAGGMIEDWLYGEWAGREQAAFALPPSLIRFDPADVVSVGIAARARDMRLSRIVDSSARHCEAVSVETARYRPTRTDPPPPPAPPPPIPTYGEVVLEVLDLPVIEETQIEYRPWLAGFADPWAGVTVLEGNRIVGQLVAQATLGITTTDLHSGTPYRFDRANSVTVKLAHGTLSAVPEDTLLAGSENALAIRNGDGDWEILQFAKAVLIAPQTWQLSTLLRGRRGTEHAMRDPVAASSRVVLLDEALTQPDVPLSDRGVLRTWDFGPSPLPSTNATFKSRSNTFETVALKPFAPVHLRGQRDLAGNLTISWIRRTRRNGTWANSSDVPLHEDSERYDLEILSGSTVVRTITGLTAPSQTYTAAEQAADFGSVQASVLVRVFQVSGTVGRGIPKEELL